MTEGGRTNEAQTVTARQARYPEPRGGVAERTKAAVLKTVRRASVSGVRIPPPPPASNPVQTSVPGDRREQSSTPPQSSSAPASRRRCDAPPPARRDADGATSTCNVCGSFSTTVAQRATRSLADSSDNRPPTHPCRSHPTDARRTSLDLPAAPESASPQLDGHSTGKADRSNVT